MADLLYGDNPQDALADRVGRYRNAPGTSYVHPLYSLFNDRRSG